MKVDLRDEFVARHLYAKGSWEPDLQRLAACVGMKDGIAVDIGANIGAHTLYFSELAGASGSVYAFEPEPYNFGLLKHNIELNRMTNVIAQSVGIGDTNTKMRMHLAKSNWGDHRVRSTGGDIDVLVMPLDEALPSSTAGRIRLIKIDVQGFESRVLGGMSQTLDLNPGAIVFAEISPIGLRDAGSSPAELLRAAADLGLKGFEYNEFRVAPIAPTWIYDRFLGRWEENLILCRDEAQLAAVLGRYLGSPVSIS